MDYLKELEQVKTGEEFYELLSRIGEAGYCFERKKGSCKDICALTLTDKYGHTLIEADSFTLYKGPLTDDIYISYIVEDGYSVGKCQLRNCSKFLKLVSWESRCKV